MIQPQSRLRVADNTGARSIQCIRVMGRSLKTTAGVGDVIIASVKQAIPNAAVKKGDVVRAVVVRTAKEYGRADGSYIRFDENAAVLIEESRPLSATKRWRLVSVIQRGGDHALPGEIVTDEVATSEAIHAAAHPGRTRDTDADATGEATADAVEEAAT